MRRLPNLGNEIFERRIPTEPESQTGTPIPFPPGHSFPFLKLPLEIRTKIYCMLFRSSVAVRPLVKRRRHLPPDPPPHRTTFPTAFLLTSRQIHDEASAVLWGDNQIVLQLPLKFASEYEKSERSRWAEKGVFQGNGIMPALRYLKHIHNLVIEVYLFRSTRHSGTDIIPAGPATQVRRELTGLCNVLQEDHQLKQLEIRFTNIRPHSDPSIYQQVFNEPNHGPLAPGTLGAPFPIGWSPSCCEFQGFWVFGTKIDRVGQIQELCRKTIQIDQQVLEPLTSLRGVRSVKIVGRVTEGWAEYLKRVMENDAGTAAGAFEHSPKVQWRSERRRRKR